jgi:pullulanase/glycogen debranching enzyme
MAMPSHAADERAIGRGKDCCGESHRRQVRPIQHIYLSPDRFSKIDQHHSIADKNWSQLQPNLDIFRFFKGMIAFRRAHPSLCRSRFWREDVFWYGVGRTVDLSPDSRSLAFCVHGASEADDDIYVMVNAYWQELLFEIQEGAPEDWLRIVDRNLPSPEDLSERGSPLQHLTYQLAPRSIVVLVRSKPKGQSVENSLTDENHRDAAKVP